MARATIEDLNREVEEAGGMDAMRADPAKFRAMLRKLDRLPPLSADRVGEIMRAMGERMKVGENASPR
jgi:hypothetical protein